MRSSIASYRESLSRIASDLSDDESDAAAPSFPPRPHAHSPDADADAPTPPSSSHGRRRRSLRTPPSSSSSSSLGLGSPLPDANGSAADHDSHPEIARYKADIQRLQASEAEIKALAFNYAAMLKDKEEQLSKLRKENGTLRKNLDAKVTTLNSPRDDRSPFNNSKGNNGQFQGQTMQENSRLTGSNSSKVVASKHDGHSNGSLHRNGVHKVLNSTIKQ